MNVVDRIALLLAVIGALNWGGVGLFGFDTVAFLFGGQMSVFSRIIYALVGLAGLWCVTMLFRFSGEEDRSAGSLPQKNSERPGPGPARMGAFAAFCPAEPEGVLGARPPEKARALPADSAVRRFHGLTAAGDGPLWWRRCP